MTKFKNWKSTLAFFIFIGIYVFAIMNSKPEGVVETTGHIALYSSIFMMFRSDFTTDMISKLIDNLKVGK
jgi:hypothetical protein